jgi:hypothetical protein
VPKGRHAVGFAATQGKANASQQPRGQGGQQNQLTADAASISRCASADHEHGKGEKNECELKLIASERECEPGEFAVHGSSLDG